MKAWRHKGKRCVAFTLEQMGKSQLIVTCGKKVHKRWLCAEHFEQGQELAAYRNRFAYVNPAKRIKKAMQRELGFGGRQWKRLKKMKQRRGKAILAETKARNRAAAADVVEATYG